LNRQQNFSYVPLRDGLSRRDWIAALLQSAAVPVALSGVTAAQEHVHQPAESDAAAPSSWRPQVLSADANEALVALGESIIPGSREAKCNQVIDLVLAIEPEKTRNELLNAVSAFDKQAQSQHKKLFRNLAPAEQDGMLNAACQPDAPLHSQFQIVKEWIADTYWSSKQGMRELGWQGRLVWPSYPGCPEHAQRQT
jgi:hypothetical protein